MTTTRQVFDNWISEKLRRGKAVVRVHEARVAGSGARLKKRDLGKLALRILAFVRGRGKARTEEILHALKDTPNRRVRTALWALVDRGDLVRFTDGKHKVYELPEVTKL